MTPTRKKRLIAVGLILLGISTATAVAIVALNDAMHFAVAPSEIRAGDIPENRYLRLAGMVAAGSVVRDQQTLDVHFLVTDCIEEVPVLFTGILPDLFREGQGVIANGRMGEDGVFHAREVLARHDELYVPPEVARAMQLKDGHVACPDNV